MSETVLQILLLVPCLIVAIVFHEVAHGLAALRLGDPTAKERNRLSLNPLRHVDPVGTLLVPGVLALASLPVFGWARPVPVNRFRLDNPRFGMMAVAAAGPATNLLLAGVGAVLLGMLARVTSPELVGPLIYLLLTFISINVFLALFNMLPIPPFDGSHVLEGLLPDRAARAYDRLRPFGFLLMLLVLVVIPQFFPGLGIVERVVMPPVDWVIGQYLALAEGIMGG